MQENVPDEIMTLEVTVPRQFAEVAAGDLGRRGGTITDRKTTAAGVVLIGFARLEKLADYGRELRDLTDGHGTFRMRSSRATHFEPPPLPKL